MPRRIKIRVREGNAITALRTQAQESPPFCRFIYAPGAGSNLHDPFGSYLAKALLGRGVETLCFQFPYMEAARSTPDSPALLEETWRVVIASVRKKSPRVPIVIGGRSMGGRIASQVVGQGEQVDGLVLFAYPLVPPGRNAEPRSAHLPSIAVPTLFVSGTRDSFGTPEQLTEAVALLPGAKLHLLDGADHGFSVLKASGRSREEVWQEGTEAILSFIESIAPEK
jgi:predicted alpha/beta-hydrolase family hydrolase